MLITNGSFTWPIRLHRNESALQSIFFYLGKYSLSKSYYGPALTPIFFAKFTNKLNSGFRKYGSLTENFSNLPVTITYFLHRSIDGRLFLDSLQK